MTEFNKDEFQNELEIWLKNNPTHKERKPFYQFLIAIALINLTKLSDKNLHKIWSKTVILHAFKTYCVPLRIQYIINIATNTIKNTMTATTASVATVTANIAAYNASANDNTRIPDTIINSIEAVYHTANAAHASVDDFFYSVYEANTIAADSAFRAAIGEFFYLYYPPFYDADACTTQISNRSIIWQQALNGNIKLDKQLFINFTKPLREIGLDFLADDLQKLIDHYTIGIDLTEDDEKRFALYAQNVAETEFDSAEKLKEALFGKKYPIFIRSLIVGEGGSGKSTLFNLLTNQKIEIGNKATIHSQHQRIEDCSKTWNITNANNNKICMELWDFAGQTQYYGLHQAFFNDNCFFILVVDSRHQQSPYDWLQQIITIIQADTDKDNYKIPLLLVINEYEDCPNQLNISDIRRRFPNLDLHIVEINLANYFDKKINEIDLDEDENQPLKNLINNLTTLETKVKKVMGKSSYEFQQNIITTLEESNYITDKSLHGMFKDELKNTIFDEWVALFGLLLPVKIKYKTVWISSQWLNNAGYQLLSELQKDEKLSYTWEEVEENIGSKIFNEEDFYHLTKKLQDPKLSLVIERINNKGIEQVIFPSILPTNDPKFVDILDKEYQLYGQFNVHIEFMQMGLFSQWVADWLQLNNKEIYLDDNNFSRYCCILTNKFDEHLLIKWHPYFKTLTFAFYYPLNAQCIVNRFSRLLKTAFQTIANDEDKVINKIDNTLGEEIHSDSTILNYFVQDLKKITKQGYIYNYFSQSIEKGRFNMTNTYHIENMSGGQIISHNDGTIIQINNEKQKDYLSALDKLLERRLEEINSQTEQHTTAINNATSLVECARNDV